MQGDDISNLITANANHQLYFNAILENGQPQFSNKHNVLGEKELGIKQKNLSFNINREKTI
ncbi:hypothetical protein, partial [Pseudoalteromonas sp. S2893]|uniref:hypothetical protein n=1 Tax=Pseudoalteromonas sp. S2893 TaxID=579530 RepID=UPI001BB1E2E5